MGVVVTVHRPDPPWSEDWQAWIGWDGDGRADDVTGWIIGAGPTRDAAVTEAVAELEAAVEKLRTKPPEAE